MNGKGKFPKLLCLALSFIVFSGLECRVEALGDSYKTLFIRELNFIIFKGPKYTWGGSSTNLQKGLDCSGYIFRAAKWAGMPVRRTTSSKMAMGACGWMSRPIQWENRDVTDLVFWTFKAARPDGHVGVIHKDINHVTHSSGSRKRVVVDRFKDQLKTKLSRIRRLTIGE